MIVANYSYEVKPAFATVGLDLWISGAVLDLAVTSDPRLLRCQSHSLAKHVWVLIIQNPF
jgi:hypothetical protein